MSTHADLTDEEEAAFLDAVALSEPRHVQTV
jgi:hypothetical protein